MGEDDARSDPSGPLFEALRARQRDACEAFVDTHYRGIYGFFLWLTQDRETAADLTQETFAAFWESTDRLDGSTALDLKAWLYGIARNRWRKWCRAMRAPCVELEEARELPDEAPGPEAVAVRAMEVEAVVRAVRDLPPDSREALVLRVFQELTYGQIADALGITVELARWRVHRARQRLRATLPAVWGTEASSGS